MDERAHAAYMADLNYFQSQLESTKDANLYFPIATISAHLNHYDDAISVAQEGLKAIPSYTQLQVLLAEAFLNTGRRDEAKELLHDAIISDSSNYKALKLLGMVYRSEDYRAEALRYLRTAFLLAPEDQEVFNWLDEIGGFPISGTSEQLDEQDEDFGDFDNDLVFNFNVDQTIEESKTAMAALVEEITGKPSSPSAATSAPAAPETQAETVEAETSAAATDDLLAGAAISDDEIMNALNKAETASEPAPDIAAQDIPAEPATSAVLSDKEIMLALNQAEAASEPVLDIAAQDTPAEPIMPAVFADALTEETSPVPETANVGEELDIPDVTLPDEFMVAAAESLPPEPPMMPTADAIDSIDDLLNDIEPSAMPPTPDIPMQIDSADSELPDLFDLEEALPAPTDPAINLDIPELGELPDPDAEIDIDEDELQHALDSFSKLPVEATVSKAEEDSRLEPIIPKGLVDQVLKESGLDTENPYDDDEPIENLLNARELAVTHDELPAFDELSTLDDVLSAGEATPTPAPDILPEPDELPALDELLPTMEEAMPMLDEVMPSAQLPADLVELTDFADLAPFDAMDDVDTMNDETANLWEIDEKMKPEMVRLWADALEEDRELTEEDEEQPKNDKE